MHRGPALVLTLALAACGGDAVEPTDGRTLLIRTDDGSVTVVVEIADTPAERSRGLMDRASLAPNAGMAFLWRETTDGAFWMKDTLIPLSIAFWDERGRIVAILDMEPCEAEPCPTYDPDVRYVGAVEVNQGFFGRHGVEVGDRVELVGAEP